ncbi:shikimate-5-dehydrogenase [Dipodascopsis uninucleata]
MDQMATKQQFYLFGRNIAFSLSPTIQNAGFRHVGLPHFYQIADIESIQEAENILKKQDFGGGSVTVPYKLDIIRYLDEISDAAKTIGAVNTIIVKQSSSGKRTLYGDNTDWFGIQQCVLDKWGNKQPTAAFSGLVIGAGGAARASVYALYILGASHIAIFNRSRAKAQAIVDEMLTYGISNVIVVDSLDTNSWSSDISSLAIIIGNIPGDALRESDFPDILFSKYNNTTPVLVEMAYKPDVTPLMKVAQKTDNWVIVRGTDVLLEQGYRQFELWTKHEAPKTTMRRALEEEVERRKKL